MNTPGYNLCSTQIFALRGLVMVCMGGIMMIVMLHARYPFYVNNFVAVLTVNIVPHFTMPLSSSPCVIRILREKMQKQRKLMNKQEESGISRMSTVPE
jgi:hypothetical protein